jgi:hypothetical protein
MGQGGIKTPQGDAVTGRDRLILALLCLVAIAAFAVAATLPR